MTLEDLVTGLPFTRDWPPELRELLIRGLEQLNAVRLQTPEWDHLVGVIVFNCEGCEDSGGLYTEIITKTQFAEKAKETDNVAQQTIDAVLSETRPGTIDVVLLGFGGELVFALPVLAAPVSPEAYS